MMHMLARKALPFHIGHQSLIYGSFQPLCRGLHWFPRKCDKHGMSSSSKGSPTTKDWRIKELRYEEMNARQREVHQTIEAGSRGEVPAPLKVWLHSSGLASKAQELGAFCRYGTHLSPRLSELAILVTGRHWNSKYEFAVHRREALRAGLSEEVVAALAVGDGGNGVPQLPPPFTRADEAVVYEFATTLHQTKEVPDELYARAVSLLGETQVVDLVGVLGYYSLISMTCNVFRIPSHPYQDPW